MALQVVVPFGLQDDITRLLKPQRVDFMRQVHVHQFRGHTESRVLSVPIDSQCCLSLQAESSFSYLEIYAIIIENINQVVIQTDRQVYWFGLMSVENLEAVVSHVTASLKKIFPDSSPGKLLKKVPPDLQERLWTLTSSVENYLNGTQGPCGGFSDTYEALCDFNEFPCRQEVQWDVDNIYHVQNCREFKLLDFSHLDSRDLSLAVAALSFSHWFTRISSKDFKVPPDVQEQIIYMITRSPTLEDVSLESCGLKLDFCMNMARALQEHNSSALRIINLSANQIEDKGVTALSQQLDRLPCGLTHLSLSKVALTPKGVGSLAGVLVQSRSLCGSLTHLDLSGNPGSMATVEATSLFKFLSGPNVLSFLDLSCTDCPLDTLFVSLSVGCCSKLSHLNLSRNIFSHRKVKEVTRSVREFFSKTAELKYIGLAGTKLPPDALRLLLQGLATNTHLCGLELDISCCELRSAGAQVIQEHIFEVKAISSLILSDNGFESDMVTLVLSIGRSHSIRHLALGGNFAMKSRALTDVLHRIVQLIQEEECPLESLSVCDSKLKTGTTILINSLASNANLSKIDISGNLIGDTGAKMLAKALMINTKLKTLIWDRNSVTAKGFMDVANALERNFTLQQMSLPMSDIFQAYRTSAERTEEAMQRIQVCLLRNNRKQNETPEHMLDLQRGLQTTYSEQIVQGLCLKLKESVRPLTCCNIQEVQSDILAAEEVLHNAKTSLLPTLYGLGRAPSSGTMLEHIIQDTSRNVTNEITEEIQELAQTLLQEAQSVCPRVVQRSSVNERLADCVAKKSRQVAHFIQSTLQEAQAHISDKLSELKLAVSISLAESIIDDVLQDLSASQQKLDRHTKEHTQPSSLKTTVPQLRVVEHEFPTDEYGLVNWRNSFHGKSIRPAPSVKSLLEVDTEQQARESAHYQQEGGEGGGGSGEGGGLLRVSGAGERRRRLSSSLATPPSVTPAGQLTFGSPSHPAREADAGAAVAAAAAALSNREPRRPEPAPPRPPMDLPIEGQALRHYTRSRPRPNRRHRQPPSKPQEQAAESENEVYENMGRVDEGVEEFFTKKIIPDDPLKHQREEALTKAQPTREPTSITIAPATTSTSTTTATATPTPPKNIKKKFGDFFAFKKVRSGRGAKGEGAPEGKAKKTSIADLIRPLREAARAEKEREKEKEREREREKEREKKVKSEDDNIKEASDVITTTTTDAVPAVVAGVEDAVPPAVPSPTPVPNTAPVSTPSPVLSPSPASDVSALSPTSPTPSPCPAPLVLPSVEREKSRTLEKSRTPDGERRPKPTRRSLREGKSQSLILLTGLEPEDSTPTTAKKHASESSSSFEQRLHVMLHRMGVGKTPPPDSKSSQVSAILDNNQEPPATFMKPRTMSTSSDTRRPRPALPERPIGPLPPKPAPKPILLPATDSPMAPRIFPAVPKQLTPSPEGQLTEAEPSQGPQPQQREGPTPSPRKETPPAPSPRRGISTVESRERSERAQSVTEETLPKPRPRMKPSPQRRAVSVHEESLLQHAALLDPEELKAALPRLQRSPVRKRANLGELPPCTEDLPEGEEGEVQD
uniref:Capping protein regulator and myosin 1 linker 2 n=1 Tax=Denticeps clupeoides TaxID=299321 RepID=A0AAY4ENI1_9TELE